MVAGSRSPLHLLLHALFVASHGVILVSGEHSTGGAHFALATPDRAVVDAVHTAALADGISVVQPPREWESDQLD